MRQLAVVVLICGFATVLSAQRGMPAQTSWKFLVSGDARNCGDVVMPAIAATAASTQSAFYWHLGDLRYMTDVDEDIRHQPERPTVTVTGYLNSVWQDAIEGQFLPFGRIPYMLAIGNHELVPPKTRDAFLLTFADWLNNPIIREQRLKDDPKDYRLKTYYRWIDRGISFYTLDNASNDMFDAAQIRWFETSLAKDNANPAITTIVVGMHKALPNGFNTHSMDESATSAETGRRIYNDLLRARDISHKKVYVLASHQHFYMEDVYATPYWKEHGGVLPGWVVGTAGAQRYALPVPSPAVAKTNVYGSLLGTVQPGGDIAFTFQQVNETDIPAPVRTRYGAEFVHWCFANNTSVR